MSVCGHCGDHPPERIVWLWLSKSHRQGPPSSASMGIPAPLLPGTRSLRGQGDISRVRREKAGQPGITVQVVSIFTTHLRDFLCF